MGSRYSPSLRRVCTSRPTPEGRMSSPRRRRILLVAAILAVLLVAAGMALPLLIDADSFRETLRLQAEAALGRPVRLGTLHLRVLPRLALTADDLALEATPQEGGGDLLTARRVIIGARIMPLLQGRVEITRIIIQHPELTLRRAAGGVWILPLPQASTSAPAPGEATTSSDKPAVLVRLLALRDGVVTLAEGEARRTIIEEFDLSLHDLALDRPLQFDAAGIWIEAGGRRRDMALGGSLAWESTGDDLLLTLSSGTIRAGDSRLSLEGRLTSSGTAPSLNLTIDDAELAEDELHDLLALAGINLPGSLSGEPLRGTAGLSWQQGQAVLSPLQMDLFGGRLRGTATLRTDPSPALFHLEGDLQGIQAGPLLRSLLDLDLLSGRLNGNLVLEGGGTTYEELLLSASGHGEVELRSGHLDGLDILASVSRASGVFGEDTVNSLTAKLAEGGMDFEQFGGPFTIQGGRIISPDLILKTADLKLTGSGSLDLLSGTVEGTFLLTLSREISASMRREGSRAARLFWNRAEERVALPLKLSGPVGAPVAGIDWHTAASAYLKNELRGNPEADLQGTLRRLLDDAVRGAIGSETQDKSPSPSPPPASTDEDTTSGDPAAAFSRVRWGGSFLAKDLKLQGWVSGTRLKDAVLSVTDSDGRVITRLDPVPEVKAWIESDPGPGDSTRIPWETRIDGKRLLAASFPLILTLRVSTRDGREVEARRAVDR
ncbi:MAG: AsmA family protein [Acidobacteria bacterium]|nr:MAG: AsmA family protein [Acidobacteriota bacterium]